MTPIILAMIMTFCQINEPSDKGMCVQEMKTCITNYQMMGMTEENICRWCMDNYYE